ncbi:unnamed protein product, partial [Ectocarpus sp. 13 AM-2016]
MANRSFPPCQRWLNNVFPNLSILPISLLPSSLPAFATPFLCPSTANAFSWLSHAQTSPCTFLLLFPAQSCTLHSPSCTTDVPR